MHKLVHNLTMILVLYHVVVGCCWHHGHVESPAPSVGGPINTACCGHDHDGHHDGQNPADHSHQQGGECDDGMCFFVVPQVDGGAMAVDRPAFSINLGSNLSRQEGASPRCPLSEPPPPAGIPPLRLHLVNQILLI